MRLCTHVHHRCSTLDVLDDYNVIITIISSSPLMSIHKKTSMSSLLECIVIIMHHHQHISALQDTNE